MECCNTVFAIHASLVFVMPEKLYVVLNTQSSTAYVLRNARFDNEPEEAEVNLGRHSPLLSTQTLV